MASFLPAGGYHAHSTVRRVPGLRYTASRLDTAITEEPSLGPHRHRLSRRSDSRLCGKRAHVRCCPHHGGVGARRLADVPLCPQDQETDTMTMRAVIGMLAVLLAAAGCASTSTGGGSGAAASGTLDRIKATKTLNLGYRDSSVPFSFAGPEQKPTGYSVDLCNRVADDLKRDLQIPDLAVKWTMVTVDTRMTAVQNGTIDLECGSTTNTLSRQALVDFSLTTFVTGASLLALKDTLTADPTKLRIAVIPGTTTEKVIKEVLAKAQPPVQFISVKDHADGRTAIENKTADAYASDREILIGLALTAQNPAS